MMHQLHWTQGLAVKRFYGKTGQTKSSWVDSLPIHIHIRGQYHNCLGRQSSRSFESVRWDYLVAFLTLTL